MAGLAAGLDKALGEPPRYYDPATKATRKWIPLTGQESIALTSGEASNPGPPKGAKSKKQAKRMSTQARQKRDRRIVQYTRRTQSMPLQVVPYATSRDMKTQSATIISTKRGLRVRHSELVDIIIGNSDGSFSVVKSLYINPGNYVLHPWLSAFAPIYTYYRYHSFTAKYIQRTNVTRDGNILIAPQYDPEVPVFTDEVSMSSAVDCKEGAVYMPHNVRFNPISMMGGVVRKYCRMNYNSPPYSDPREFDSGKMTVAISGTGASTGMGKLWVEYDVEFIDPTRLSVLTEAAPYSGSAISSSDGSVTTTSMFGAAPILYGGLAYSLALVNNQITLPVGTWLVIFRFTGTGIDTDLNPNISQTQPGTTVTRLSGIGNAAADAGTLGLVYYYVVVTRQGSPSFTFGNLNTSMTTLTATHVRIANYSTSDPTIN